MIMSNANENLHKCLRVPLTSATDTSTGCEIDMGPRLNQRCRVTPLIQPFPKIIGTKIGLIKECSDTSV